MTEKGTPAQAAEDVARQFEREYAAEAIASPAPSSLSIDDNELRYTNARGVTTKVAAHPGPPPAPPRTVTYSPETIQAYAAVIEAGMKSGGDDFLIALRQLATMVHCDMTGELRGPHTLVALSRDE